MKIRHLNKRGAYLLAAWARSAPNEALHLGHEQDGPRRRSLLALGAIELVPEHDDVYRLTQRGLDLSLDSYFRWRVEAWRKEDRERWLAKGETR